MIKTKIKFEILPKNPKSVQIKNLSVKIATPQSLNGRSLKLPVQKLNALGLILRPPLFILIIIKRILIKYKKGFYKI